MWEYYTTYLLYSRNFDNTSTDTWNSEKWKYKQGKTKMKGDTTTLNTFCYIINMQKQEHKDRITTQYSLEWMLCKATTTKTYPASKM